MKNFGRMFCLILCFNLCFYNSLAFDIQLNVLNHVLEKEAEFKVCNLTDSGEPNVINLGLVVGASDSVLNKLKDQESKIKRLEELNRKLVFQIDRVEQETRVNNLIFRNIKETKLESPILSMSKVLHFLNNNMRVRIKSRDISMAIRVDTKNATKVRPIIVRFNSFEQKMRVLEAGKKLINSEVKISADYSELVKQRREKLLPFLLEKKALGSHTFIYYDKLMVNGVKVSLEDLQAEKRVREQSSTDPTTTNTAGKDLTSAKKDGEDQMNVQVKNDQRVVLTTTTQDPTVQVPTTTQDLEVPTTTQDLEIPNTSEENYDFFYEDY